jgi:hypothetical protein
VILVLPFASDAPNCSPESPTPGGKTFPFPVDSQISVENGAASLQDGFPPNTMRQVAAGGIWPFGQDMNGILYAISSNIVALTGGQFYTYSAAWAAANAGYAVGAVIQQISNPFGFWVNLSSGNTTNPDTGGAGWSAGAIGTNITTAETLAGSTPVNYVIQPGQVDRYFNNTTPGTSDATAGFSAAIAQAGQVGGAPVIVNSVLYIASNVTIPYGIPIVFTGAGSVVVAAGKTFTINGPISAPRAHIFTGSGNVIFSQGSCARGYFEWFGAVPNSNPSTFGFDCTAAIATALTAFAGGSGSNIGVVPIEPVGYYLTGAQQFPPATVIRGESRHDTGFIAKAGTSGVWLGDNGVDAAGICLYGVAIYANSANCPSMTTALRLGTAGAQWGTEASINDIWVRDCACSGGAFAVDIYGNVGIIGDVTIYGNAAVSSGSSLMRIGGGANKATGTLILNGAGPNAYSLYMNAPGSSVVAVHIEAPATCSSGFAPISLQATARIKHCSMSLNNTASTTFDHLVEVGVNCYSWDLAIDYLNAAGLATVTGGNIYDISKGTYFGGTVQTSSGNTQGSGAYISGFGNVLRGKATFAAQTNVAVTLPWGQTVSNYMPRLQCDATVASSGSPYPTSIGTNGFTITFPSAYTGNVYWDISI